MMARQTEDGFPIESGAGGFDCLGIVCPYCNERFVHFSGPATRNENNRDPFVEIPFEGESCGHRWACIFTFHEGAMLCVTRRLPDVAYSDYTRTPSPIPLQEGWANVGDYLLRNKYIKLHGLLKQTNHHAVTIDEDYLTIRFSPSHKFVMAQVSLPQHRKTLEDIVSSVFHRRLIVRCVLEQEHINTPPPQPVRQHRQPVSRKGLSASIRWFIIREHDYTCVYCKRRHHSSKVGPGGEPWNLDHAHPLARGGADEPENLVLSCAACNRKKHAKMPNEFQT